jgi:heme-degrading monooxygenase HmoA
LKYHPFNSRIAIGEARSNRQNVVMPLEVAMIDVTPGTEEQFVTAYLEARLALLDTPGVRSAELAQGVELPSRFVLRVDWDTVQAHEQFRASEAFGEWRASVGSYFAAAPQGAHYTPIDTQ